MEYITSDWHLNHEKILGFEESRNIFNSVEEMNETIIKNTNNVLTNKDTLYILGDVSLYMKPKELFETLDSVKGNLVIVLGNHDSKSKMNYLLNNNYKLPNGKDKFEIHEVGLSVKRNGVKYIMTHYPLQVGGKRKNIRSLCGHIHGYPVDFATGLNIGVDSPEIPKDRPFGEPITLDKAIELVENKYKEYRDTLNPY